MDDMNLTRGTDPGQASVAPASLPKNKKILMLKDLTRV